MNWRDHTSYIELFPPKEFNFGECLIFLGRSDREILHIIKGEAIYKVLKEKDSLILCKISYSMNSIKVEFPLVIPPIEERKTVAEYIWEWFDLAQSLEGFYEIASRDRVLQPLAVHYYGLRIMGIPDLFEAMVWAITGQQINLTFAYTLKQRFVERFGESISYEGEKFWLFPSFEEIASLHVDDLRRLQFTMRKAEYIIGLAKEMESGQLTKDELLQMDVEQVRKALMSIRGVGAWTADYVMMKCLHQPTAFPIADVGLHNALKNQLGLKEKPTIEEIKEYAANWEGWQAYATFYLWRSLYDKV